MPLETVTYISDLVATNPLGSDLAATADDHCRIIKSAIKNTFPNINGAVNATDEELNFVDGVTSAIQTQLDSKLGIGTNGSVSTSLIFVAPTQFTGTASFATNVGVSRSESGGTVDLRVSNESNTASSRARLTTRVAGTSAEDAIVNYEISGGQQYTSGIDNSDSDTFKIQGGASLSASGGLSITTGNVVRYDAKEIGFRNANNVQFSGNTTLSDGDRGKLHQYTGAGGHTVTVPTTGVTQGAVFPLLCNAGTLTLSPSSGTLFWFSGAGLTTGNRSLATGAAVTIICSANATADAYVFGTGIS